jgi:hypothetical protein
MTKASVPHSIIFETRSKFPISCFAPPRAITLSTGRVTKTIGHADIDMLYSFDASTRFKMMGITKICMEADIKPEEDKMKPIVEGYKKKYKSRRDYPTRKMKLTEHPSPPFRMGV